MSSNFKDDRLESKKFLAPLLDDPNLSEGKKFAMKYRSFRKGQTTARATLKVSELNDE